MEDQEKKNKRQVQRDQEDVLARKLRNFQAKLKENSLDAFIVSSSPNKHYLTGWETDSESGWKVISQSKSHILTDFRYTEHANRNTKNFEVLEYDTSLPKFFGELSKKQRFNRVGFESHDLSLFNFRELKKYSRHLKILPHAHFVEDLRSIKDSVEISNLKKAVNVADEAFEYILEILKVGMTEKEIAWEMEKYMRDNGAQKMAWEPFIVAAGPHSSMAHWGASNTKIKKGDMVLVDYGCVYNGYHSDTTRVLFMGEPTSEQKRIYNLVFEAQKLGKELVKDGAVGASIDKKVRGFLETETKYFYRHSLGHGVGLEVHELPRLSIQSKNKLEIGNVVTIEPGIYIPDWGGVRLEDIVVVKNDGCETITKAPKEIKEVTI